MALLDYNHPDIIKFIDAKLAGGFSNFNFSVSVTDSFMRKVIGGNDYWLINTRTNERVSKVNAREVFNKIALNAWRNGEPGMIFIDEINRKHPLKEKIKAVNPCAEQPLLPYESCNLGSINLSKMFDGEGINWARLERVVKLGVHFLDNVIDVNRFPLTQIKEKTLSNRKIGLGVMGFADLLIQLGVPYDSKDALMIAGNIMGFIHDKARNESQKLGLERGSFPNFKASKLAHKFKAMRNATVTTIAPTGTISIIAGCSSGIEPLFAVSFMHNILGGGRLLTVNTFFENALVRNGIYSKKLVKDIAVKGSLKRFKLPARVKRVFRTALEISPEWHVRMQSVFQHHIDNAVSKTVNLPFNATVADAAKVFLLAYKLKCKGITLYRYNSRNEQVLSFGCDKCS